MLAFTGHTHVYRQKFCTKFLWIFPLCFYLELNPERALMRMVQLCNLSIYLDGFPVYNLGHLIQWCKIGPYTAVLNTEEHMQSFVVFTFTSWKLTRNTPSPKHKRNRTLESNSNFCKFVRQEFMSACRHRLSIYLLQIQMIQEGFSSLVPYCPLCKIKTLRDTYQNLMLEMFQFAIELLLYSSLQMATCFLR